MTCSQARRWLNLYVDERLSLQRYAALERHMRACSACRQELNFLETLRASVADAEGGRIPQPEPEELTANIMSRVALFEEQRAVEGATKAQRRHAARSAKAARRGAAADAAGAPRVRQRAALAPAAVASAPSGARPWIGLIWLDWVQRSSMWMAWRRWQNARPSRRWVSALVALVALALAAFVWPAPFGASVTPAQMTQLTPGRLLSDAEQWLLTPGPDAIIWGVWVAGAVVALVAVAWFARADASAEWRRALVERLPQLW